MANQEHLDILKQGVEAWNEWRESNPKITTRDLSGADLIEANLSGANLIGANLIEANLIEGEPHTGRTSAGRTSPEQTSAGRTSAGRTSAPGRTSAGRNLSGRTSPGRTSAGRTSAGRTSLTPRWWKQTLRVPTLPAVYIYGISAWNLKVNEETKQSSLIITKYDEPTITVDDLEVAQFIYLLLNREKLRNIIDTITSKAVLILGRFTPERKAVLDAMANAASEAQPFADHL